MIHMGTVAMFDCRDRVKLPRNLSSTLSNIFDEKTLKELLQLGDIIHLYVEKPYTCFEDNVHYAFWA